MSRSTLSTRFSALWTARGWLVPLALMTTVLTALPFWGLAQTATNRTSYLVLIHLFFAFLLLAPVWNALYCKLFDNKQTSTFLTLPIRTWTAVLGWAEGLFTIVVLIGHFFL